MSSAGPAPVQAFFEPLGEGRYRSSELTLGPWGGGSQHGGPPSALMGREMQHHQPREGMEIFRFTGEILRPVPAAELAVQVRTVRSGRWVELLEGVMTADGVEVMRATAWRVTVQRGGAEALPPSPPMPGPEQGIDAPFFDVGLDAGYHTAMEWRFVKGAFLDRGPAKVWLRMRVPLVAGEEPTGLQRVLCTADSGNGVSAVASARELRFINTDMTVHLRRHARGEWIGMDAHTAIDANGVGLAETELHDLDGSLGRGAQILLVAPWDT